MLLPLPLTDALWSSARHLADDAQVYDAAPLDAVLSLRRGGTAVLLAPASFLDDHVSTPRLRLCCHTELLLALRLPQGAVADAVADAVSHDVLVLRRRDVDLLRPVGDWLESARLDEEADDQWAAACVMRPGFGAMELNRYWHKWPGHALGKWTTERGQGGAVEIAVKRRGGEGLEETCHDVVATVLQWLDAQAALCAAKRAAEAPAMPPPTAVLTPRDRAAKRCLDAFRAVLVAQQRGGAFDDEQRLLGAVYSAFVSRWGLLRDVDRDTVCAELRAAWPLLRSLETRGGGRAAVFSKRVVAVVQ